MSVQLEFSYEDYFADTFGASQRNTESLMEELEEIPEKSSRKKFAYDVGNELLGSRKHLAAMSRFTPGWFQILEEDPAAAFATITKSLFADQFNSSSLKENGFQSEVAYAIKLMWDRVCKQPVDDPKQRENFVKGINELSGIFSEAYTKELFLDAFTGLKDGVMKARYSRYAHYVNRDPLLTEFAFWLSLGDRFISIFYSVKSTAGYHKIFKRAFESDEGKEWRWTEAKERNNAKKENSLRWERQVPQEVIRLSQEPSGIGKPEDLIEVYGYRGVQFGNWVQDAAGLYHVLCSGNAHADLAKVLDLPHKSLSFYGALGLAFGARGSGRASAHYEPVNNVINLTKINGGGSLCHEWAHALDFNLNSYANYFTNGRAKGMSADAAGRLPSDISRAFKQLMHRIKSGSAYLKIEVPDNLSDVKRNYVSGIFKNLQESNYDISTALSNLKGVYRIKGKQWEDIGFLYCQLIKESGRPVPKEFYVPTKNSSFYLDAKTRGKYWCRDHELFARAFEAWIEDELFSRGMTNTYLVSGTRCDSGPYPRGEERDSINTAFRNWWSVLHNSGILQNEELWQKS